RIVLPAIQRWINVEKAPRINVQRLLNIIGVFTMVLVAVMWTTALRIWLFPGEMRSSYAEVNWGNLSAATPASLLILVFLYCVLYLVATRRSYDLLNLASLHNLYRARIERAYVSSGNGGRTAARFLGSALDTVDQTATTSIWKL